MVRCYECNDNEQGEKQVFREEIKIGVNHERIVITVNEPYYEVVIKEFDPWGNKVAHQCLGSKALDEYIKVLQKAQKEIVKLKLSRSFHALYKSK